MTNWPLGKRHFWEKSSISRIEKFYLFVFPNATGLSVLNQNAYYELFKPKEARNWTGRYQRRKLWSHYRISPLIHHFSIILLQFPFRNSLPEIRSDVVSLVCATFRCADNSWDSVRRAKIDTNKEIFPTRDFLSCRDSPCVLFQLGKEHKVDGMGLSVLRGIGRDSGRFVSNHKVFVVL